MCFMMGDGMAMGGFGMFFGSLINILVIIILIFLAICLYQKITRRK